MSYHFSQALVEAYSQDNSLDGELSVLLKSNLIAGKCSCVVKTKDTCRLSRYGTTCEHLTESRGEDLLTWFQEVFLARTSALRGRVLDSVGPGLDSGLKWRELSMKFDPVTCSWKTHLSLLEEDLNESSVILPKWGMMRGGVFWEQVTLELPIVANVSGYWPTPTATAATQGINKPNGKRGQTLLGAVKGQDWSWSRFPTPCARDYRSGKGKSQAERGKKTGPNLPQFLGGTLNPPWVEWLMGWPLGWTDLKPFGNGQVPGVAATAWRILNGN